MSHGDTGSLLRTEQFDAADNCSFICTHSILTLISFVFCYEFTLCFLCAGVVSVDIVRTVISGVLCACIKVSGKAIVNEQVHD